MDSKCCEYAGSVVSCQRSVAGFALTLRVSVVSGQFAFVSGQWSVAGLSGPERVYRVFLAAPVDGIPPRSRPPGQDIGDGDPAEIVPISASSFQQVSVSSRSGEVDSLVVQLINAHPVGLDVAVSKSLPFPTELVVSMVGLQRMPKSKCFHDDPKSIDVLTSFPQSFQVAFKRLGRNKGPRRQSAVRGHVVISPASWPVPWRPRNDSARAFG